MDKIDKLISACESMMIDDRDIANEGLSEIVLAAHGVALGMVSIGLIINNLKRKKANKKLTNRDFIMIYSYIDDAKEVELTKNLLNAINKYSATAPTLLKEADKLVKDVVLLSKKYNGNIPVSIKNDIDKKVSNIEKNCVKLKEMNDKLIINDNSEKMDGLKYKNNIFKAAKITYDIDDVLAENGWENVAYILGFKDPYTSEGSEETLIDNSYRYVHPIYKLMDKIKTDGGNILSKVKIRVK